MDGEKMRSKQETEGFERNVLISRSGAASWLRKPPLLPAAGDSAEHEEPPGASSSPAKIHQSKSEDERKREKGRAGEEGEKEVKRRKVGEPRSLPV